MADELNPIIKAYRKGESTPLKLPRAQIIGMLNAINTGIANGMPKIGADNYGDKVLLEGRADAGANDFNYNNKKALSIVGKVTQDTPNVSSSGATYVGAVVDKLDVATRLGIPFERAWNGTGKSPQTGRTGKQHSTRADQMVGAIDDPKNSELKDIITRGIAGNLTSAEQATQVGWDTLRYNFAGGPGNLIMDGTYTKEATDGMRSTVEQKISDAKLPTKRADAVRTDLKSMPDLLNDLPILWQAASGLKTDKLKNLDMSKMSPDTIGILNSIIGIN